MFSECGVVAVLRGWSLWRILLTKPRCLPCGTILVYYDDYFRVRSSCCFEGVELVENTADLAKVSAVWDDTRPLSEINTDPEIPHQLQDHLEPYGMEVCLINGFQSIHPFIYSRNFHLDLWHF